MRLRHIEPFELTLRDFDFFPPLRIKTLHHLSCPEANEEARIYGSHVKSRLWNHPRILQSCRKLLQPNAIPARNSWKEEEQNVKPFIENRRRSGCLSFPLKEIHLSTKGKQHPDQKNIRWEEHSLAWLQYPLPRFSTYSWWYERSHLLCVHFAFITLFQIWRSLFSMCRFIGQKTSFWLCWKAQK